MFLLQFSIMSSICAVFGLRTDFRGCVKGVVVLFYLRISTSGAASESRSFGQKSLGMCLFWCVDATDRPFWLCPACKQNEDEIHACMRVCEWVGACVQARVCCLHAINGIWKSKPTVHGVKWVIWLCRGKTRVSVWDLNSAWLGWGFSLTVRPPY